MNDDIRDRLVDAEQTYYRLGIATKEQAEAMYRLAEDIHRYLVDMTRVSHECLRHG
ncbi:hypothetical protein [Halopenitus persicus]|uniref:DUF8154 domain-containing protein n=1 Tax=Halopenitus persicus TaxID=1048396 RepID=A0A1H3NXJ2_9EURY|nr:hypothetical protein [Halopenitus persicus]SDY93597.1 hypothetical protein SAMN05216564_11631 [Halopenitus persicus]